MNQPVQASLFGDTLCPGAGQTLVFAVAGHDDPDETQPRAMGCPACAATFRVFRAVGVITDTKEWTGRSSYLVPSHGAVTEPRP